MSSTTPPGRPGVPTTVIVGVVVALALAILLWVLLHGGDDATEGAGSSASPSGVRSQSPGTSVVPGAGKTVPTEPVRTRAPVPLARRVELATGISLRVVGTRVGTARARVPGELSGRALFVSVEVGNDSGAPVPLDGALVDVGLGRPAAPAVAMTAGSRPLSGRLAPGRTTTGVYVVSLREHPSRLVTLSITYRPGAPVSVLRGVVR